MSIRPNMIPTSEALQMERLRARQEFERRKVQTLTVAGQSVISRRWRGNRVPMLGRPHIASSSTETHPAPAN